MEHNDDGKHVFKQINQDEWSIYLENKGTGAEIQIDLYLKKISIKERGANQHVPLYNIIKAYR